MSSASGKHFASVAFRCSRVVCQQCCRSRERSIGRSCKRAPKRVSTRKFASGARESLATNVAT
eukprot:3085807-Lingulodinium_polyedra.AAC.1